MALSLTTVFSFIVKYGLVLIFREFELTLHYLGFINMSRCFEDKIRIWFLVEKTDPNFSSKQFFHPKSSKGITPPCPCLSHSFLSFGVFICTTTALSSLPAYTSVFRYIFRLLPYQEIGHFHSRFLRNQVHMKL